jgi:hypothetical protein
MNAFNPNTTPAPDCDPVRSDLVLKCDYRQEDFACWPRPSELELATLAARLARSGKLDAKQLVTQAWELYWESCRQLKADYQETEKYHENMAREEDAESDDDVIGLPKWVPVPKRYPMTYRDLEALLLPKRKGRTAERAGLLREYIFSQLVRHCIVLRPKIHVAGYWELPAERLELLREHLRDEVARYFEKYRKTVYDAGAYARFAVPFLTWHQQFIASKKSAAARKRWSKKKDKQKKPESESAQGAPGELEKAVK